MTVTNRSVRRGGGRQRPEARRPPVVPDTGDLACARRRARAGPFTCNLGRLAPGASATVTAVTEAIRAGVVVEHRPRGLRRRSSRTTGTTSRPHWHVVGPSAPHAGDVCRTLAGATAAFSRSGRSSVVRVTCARNARSTARVADSRFALAAPGVDRRARTNRQGIARFTVITCAASGSIALHRRTGRRARRPGRCECQTLARRPAARATRGHGLSRGTMSIGVPSGASRRSRCRHVVRHADAAVRHRLSEQPGQVRAVDPDDVRRPVGDVRERRRLERERAEERVGRHERRLDVEVTAARGLRSRTHPTAATLAKHELAVADATDLDPSRSEADDDPVHDRPHLDGVRPDPAAGSVRVPGKAEPVPPAPLVLSPTRREREHDLELVVGAEAAQPPDHSR